MLKTAFSSLACPDWTLDRILALAGTARFDGVELRTFGAGGTELPSEPAQVAWEKVRAWAREAGVRICCLSTSVRFDAPVWPPVLGRLSDTEQSVREAKSAIDLAAQLECPFVRVFGFELAPTERRRRGLERIAARLALAADHARNTGVRLVVENGGSFPTAADLAEIIDAVDSPLVGACYSQAVGVAAGEPPAAAVNVLGERLLVARVKDARGGFPCALGTGDARADEFVRAVAALAHEAWAVYEWDRLWFPELEGAERMMPEVSALLHRWARATRADERGTDAAPARGPGVAPRRPVRV